MSSPALRVVNLTLARKVHDGELDTWLAQPKSVLVQALGSRTQMSGWGDLASGASVCSRSRAR